MTEPVPVLRETVAPCEIHGEHKPNPRLNHRHHIWPRGEGGPDIADNIVVVCPTGHVNIHELIKEFKLHLGEPPYVVLRQFTFKERIIAKAGYESIMAHKLVGRNEVGEGLGLR